jgi:CheY-like chemotaxis protein
MLTPSALDEMLERAREALEGTQRIKKITRGIGTFARVESPERTRVDLNLAIDRAAKMAQSDIKFRARLVLDLGQLPAVSANEGKLSQVFLNLLINAVHAVEVGRAQENRVEIRTWVDDDQVFADVRDTGKGNAPADLKRIFETYYTTNVVCVGTGLGLPICRTILAEVGGEISVASVLGQGTRVLVRLPSDRGAAVAPAPADTLRATAPTTSGRILVVDDEPGIRAVVLRVLGATHEFVTAASGTEARAILEHDQAFDVILCDIMMPDMTGTELHAWLAGQFPVLAERVVFASGGAFDPKTRDYLSRIDNLVLEKPYAPAELRRVVSLAMVRQRDA